MIIERIQKLTPYRKILSDLKEGKTIAPLGLPRSARLPVMAALYADLNLPVVLITDRADHAMSLFDESGYWLRSPRYFFNEPNPLFYEQAAWGSTTRRERLAALTALAAYHLPFAPKPAEPPLIVASARALMTRTLPRRDYLKASRRLVEGQKV